MLAPTLAEPRLIPLLEHGASGAGGRGGRLPAPIERRYGGPLAIPLRSGRPTVIANFVSTLDGVVSYNTPEASGGGEISGFFEPDRFVMGTLRALADVVLIGAGTVRAAVDERWTADDIHPDSAPQFAALRRQLGLRPHPITAVVTASGEIDLEHPGLSDPAVDAVILTTGAGAAALNRGPVPDHVQVRGVGDAVTPGEIVASLAGDGAQLVLCEGGPHLIGQMFDAGLVDELFLTIAPQLAGRSTEVPRLGLIEGTAFDVSGAPWARLVDLRVAGDHLFTRYRFDGRTAS